MNSVRMRGRRLFCFKTDIPVHQASLPYRAVLSKIIKSDEALKPFRVVNKLVEILRNSRIENNINQQDLEKIFVSLSD